ncbi:hypothetical protein RBB50_005029 [Rhinocladiella similis]
MVLESGMQICKLLSEMMERFELGAIPPLAVPQGALAASTLLTSIPHIENSKLKNSASSQLDFLQGFFSSMAAVNGPAERLARSLHAHRNPGDVSGVVPAQDNTHIPCTFDPPAKFPFTGSNVYIHQTAAHIDADEEMFNQQLHHHHHSDIMISGSPYYAGSHTSLGSTPPSADVTGFTGSPDGQAGVGAALSSSELVRVKQGSTSSKARSGNGLGYHSTTPTSAHSLPRSFSPLTPAQMESSSASENLHMEQHHSVPAEDQTMLPIDDSITDGWEDVDAVRISWSETFKALGAVNSRTAGEKMSANEFGDVMGCVFQL